jgi:hypothetical protein
MAEDQLAQDKSVRALLRNHMDGRPLVLLADDRYKLFPYNLAASDCTYVVLGFYHVTYAWGISFWYSIDGWLTNSASSGVSLGRK